MIVKINGVAIQHRQPLLTEKEFADGLQKIGLKQLAITMWTTCGILVSQAAHATDGDLWSAGQNLFGVFQQIGMFIGGIAIMVGLILLLVKKKWGVETIKLTGIMLVGVFIVPSAILLLAIIGKGLNKALEAAFSHMS